MELPAHLAAVQRSMQSLSPVVLVAQPCVFSFCVAPQIYGDYFGPVQPNLVEVVAGRSAPLPSVGTLVARNCAPYDDSHTQVRCTIPAGVGRDFRWSVTVAGVKSALSPVTTSFGPPVVTSHSLRVSSGSAAVLRSLPTPGGVVVTISGSNFGSDEGQVRLSACPVCFICFIIFTCPCVRNASL
jgi:hypothetical protein